MTALSLLRAVSAARLDAAEVIADRAVAHDDPQLLALDAAESALDAHDFDRDYYRSSTALYGAAVPRAGERRGGRFAPEQMPTAVECMRQRDERIAL